MLASIAKKLFNSPQFETAITKLKDQSVVTLAGLNGSALSFFADFIYRSGSNKVVIAAADSQHAEQLWCDLSQLQSEELVLYFPSFLENSRLTHRMHSEIVGMRLKTLDHLLQSQTGIFITTVSALTEAIPSAEKLKQIRLLLKTGTEVSLETLARQLLDFGYARTDLVSGVGEFCVRGGLLDVFPYESLEPIRIEFFGDVIDSLRSFDVINQRSIKKIDQIILLPPQTDFTHLQETSQNTLLSYFSNETILLLDEPEQFERALQENLLKSTDLYQADESPVEWNEDLVKLQMQRLLDQFAQFRHFEHHHLGQLQRMDVHFKMTTHEDLRGNIRLLRQKIERFSREKKQKESTQIFILLEEKYEVERISDLIKEEHENGRVEIGQGVLHSGFIYPAGGLVVFTEKDLYGRAPRKKNFSKYRGGIPLAKLNALIPGDIMVHVDHGIGRYVKLEKISVAGSERECLKLQYLDGDFLYVNIEHLHRVSKYKGAEGVVPQLNRLGGKDWERLKDRTKKAIEQIARDQLQLYALRKAKKGHAFAQDQLWQRELEASFVYDETEDQLRTIEEVKRDMETDIPMDRLVCGDVGFGKTEVALRAAFKAVMDGKQVAILVPTTVLAQQHYNTFVERLMNYPIEIGLMSRFRTKKQQQQILERAKKGTIDIVIGTHRLLSKDVQFKDLGLLIVDEEHRFGVRQKDKIKTVFKLIDVLSLTATPIPRTLYLSLMGNRDMSVINTPPKERLSIITEVAPFDQKLIRRAILDEIQRGGQVFVVHNRVRSIDSVAKMVKKIVPELRVAIAHGQMSSHHLEKVMAEFVQKKYDCLVSTMIIESGLDMPNVNTLIVNRADKLGLAQLYQLKGRVGRSNRQAFAYFLVPPFKFLSTTALKRLQTIEEHLELGAGLQIAMKDLEIRGAGNLLGSQQSGFINAVGFDLYSRLLEETVAKINGETRLEKEASPAIDVLVEVDYDAYIPEEYVQMDYERVNFYQGLMTAQSDEDLLDREEELRDRFGPLPKPVRVLFEISRLRLLCASLGIDKLRIKKSDLTAYFSEEYYTPANKELLQKVVRSIQKSSPELLRFLQGKKFGFKFHLQHTDETSLHFTREFFSRVLHHAA